MANVLIAFDGQTPPDTPCSDLFRSSINANSLANISFPFLLRTPNCLQKQSLWEKRARRFSWRQEVFSISTSSFARSSAFSAWFLSSFFCRDSFYLSAQFSRETISKESKRSYEIAYNHFGSLQNCTWDSFHDSDHNN